MIKKQFVKSRQVTKVTFEMPADTDADAVYLMGDFTGWQPVPFQQLKSGKWKLVHEFEPGSSHQFRYKIVDGDSETYHNDADADGYVANDQGTDNAVLNA